MIQLISIQGSAVRLVLRMLYFNFFVYALTYGLILTLCLLMIYQLHFHPLRGFPGPFWAKITDAYGGINALTKRAHLATYQNHLQYGPVYRQAPNRLMFNSVGALQDIFLNPGVTKGQAYVDSRLVPSPSLFDTLDQAEHGRKQRIIGKVISELSMRSFEPVMNSQVDIFLSEILKSARKGAVVDVSPRCSRLAADVICHLGFGYPLSTQTEETNRPLLEAFSQVSGRIALYMNWPSTSKLLDALIAWLAHKASEDFRKSIQNMVEARMALDRDAKHDLYKIALSDKKSSDEGLLESELWAEAVFFITAASGGATTSALMSAVLFYLSRNLEIYHRLASEIRTTFSSGRDIRSGPQLASCKFLRAVINETLRMSPSSIGTLWRQQDLALPSEVGKPFIVDGHVVTPGTMVGLSPYSLLHNEKYFPEPFIFRPERHLGTEKGSETTDTMRAFAPFAVGSRSCGGRAVAYLEASLTVAKTIWYFDFERAKGKADELGEGGPGLGKGRERKSEFQVYDVITAEHKGPNLVFKPRGQHWKELVEQV
ncbi:hypothetical protein J7T55_007946 [Diaporthe amygdali]|uniref:uncharacterized protein n=1 Tax=Phomopsis amygdali TaxID=1214568 RepID=UPI0022FDF3D3|nr:uncharacterized protein J7T55_007946 [Diaporthe amygdali]KAJ0114112.1 hypothetical protein J7T55_007946 [Diaporthe amygdali]